MMAQLHQQNQKLQGMDGGRSGRQNAFRQPLPLSEASLQHRTGEEALAQQVSLTKRRGMVKRYVCQDPSDLGIPHSLRANKSLKGCEQCSHNTQYHDPHSAATHLRNVHFTSRAQEGAASSKNEDWPPMNELMLWVREVPLMQEEFGTPMDQAEFTIPMFPKLMDPAELSVPVGTDGGDGSMGALEDQQKWACHFFKSDPIRYSACLHFEGKRMADVRQHHVRKHREEAERIKKHEGKKRRTNVERWFDIWGDLFPNQAFPATPYVESGVFGLVHAWIAKYLPMGEDAPRAPMNASNVEMPFTDSGYASAPLGDPKSPVGEDSDENNCDERTYISAATTVVPVVVQHSISEVCDDIYNRVQRHVGEHNKSLFDGMPDLIKAFAIRLAHLDPSDSNRRIMHFVYSHHR